MALDTSDNTLVEPSVIEVDEITEAIDPNDAILDNDGKVIQYLDREKNVTVKLKGSKNPFEAEKTAEQIEAEKKAADPAKEQKDGEPEPDGEGNDDGDQEGEIEYVNEADYILKKSGYDKDEVDLGEGIGKVKIADLTPEQQLIVIRGEYDETIKEFQEHINELEAREPELKFDNPQAQQIVDYLKEGGDPIKLAKEILSKDPAAQAKMLSDVDVVKLSLKKDFPEWSDDDIAAEVGDMKKEQIERRAKALRSKMEKEQPDLSTLTAEQKAAKAAERQREIESFKAEAEGVKKVAKSLKQIAGINIDDKVTNYLLNKVIPPSIDEDSAFIKGLNSPERLMRLEFLDTFGEKLIQMAEQKGYRKAMAELNKGKENLSDEPVRVYQGGKSGVKSKTQAPKSLDDMSFDEFLNAGSF